MLSLPVKKVKKRHNATMQILISPLITEKSLAKTEKGYYTFIVAKKANKPQIAKAVSDLYNVSVSSVNVIRVKGEEKLIRGRFKTTTKDYKKAIVALKEGQKIPGFGVEEKKEAKQAKKEAKKNAEG